MKPLDLDARTFIGNNWNGQSPNKNVQCDVSYQTGERNVLCPKNNIGGKLDLDHCFYTKDGKWSCNEAYTPGGPSSEAKPETTTLTNVDPETCGDDCKIVFHVTRYMVCRDWERDYPPNKYCPQRATFPIEDTGKLIDAEAEVKVFNGDNQVAHFFMNTQDGQVQDGEIRYPDTNGYEEWWVFYIDVKTGTVKNCNDKSVTCFPLPGTR